MTECMISWFEVNLNLNTDELAVETVFELFELTKLTYHPSGG